MIELIYGLEERMFDIFGTKRRAAERQERKARIAAIREEEWARVSAIIEKKRTEGVGPQERICRHCEHFVNSVKEECRECKEFSPVEGIRIRMCLVERTDPNGACGPEGKMFLQCNTSREVFYWMWYRRTEPVLMGLGKEWSPPRGWAFSEEAIRKVNEIKRGG